ncbi:DUF3857 domain-containing protein [Pontibacter beigongshangensis]|uniref:DUF3857 domain-containing protein n=1 Tax=Pontibacter beigongshangensis TaxID=2574733 RepID=UPI00164FF2DC|nr:DUF3857 domain-containing protein [Pontibacter beigongshangensis]
MKHFYGRGITTLLTIIFSMALHLQVQAANKQLTITPAPTWIKQLPHRTSTTIDLKEVNDGYHFLQRVLQWNVASGEVYYHNTYKLTTDEGVQNSSELKFSYDPNFEKLQLHKLVVWRNGKPIEKLDLKKIKVVQREQGLEQKIFDESLTAIIFLEDTRVGDVVEYAITISGKNPVFNDKFFNSFNLQFYDPVDELLVHVVAPEHRKINYKLYKTEQKPVVATQNGFTTYTWHAQNLPATPVDEEIPDWYDAYPGVYLSEFATWEQVAKWTLPLYNQPEKPNKALLALIDSIREEYASDEQRVVAALRFVQDEVRYLGFEAGIGGYKPRAPSEVFSKRFGDCKDKSLLLVTMLRELGIEADPALVSSSNRGQVAQMLPSPYAFNHCIVQVRLWDKQFWYDPTISKQRGSHDAISLPDYQKALVLNAATKKLTDVTAPVAGKGKVKVQEAFFFNDIGGDVKLEVKTEYYGSEADYQRSRFATTSMKETEKSFLNYYANSYPDIEVARDLEFLDFPSENKFTTLEEYTIAGLWEESEDTKGQLSASFYPQVLRSYISTPRVSKRSMPMHLSYPTQVEHDILLYLPEAWTVKPASKEINHEVFTYSSKMAYNSRSYLVTLSYAYTTLQDHVLPEQMANFVKHQKALLDDLGYSLSYNQNFAAVVADGPISWPAVLLAVAVLALVCFGAYKLYFYDPAPIGNYTGAPADSIGGWLVLIMIGLFVSPLRTLLVLVTENYFNQQLWHSFLSPDSAAYAPATAILLALEIVLHIVFFVYAILLISLFLQRRTSVPRLIAIFYFSSFAVRVAQYAAMDALNLPSETVSGMSDIMGSLITAAIWVPYFYKSQRVKDTFVVQLQPPVQQEDLIEEAATMANN